METREAGSERECALSLPELPRQWRIAKIVLLKNPNKEDYSQAKAWRPISLLTTFGNLLEAVVAERMSFAVESYGLLPTNHFGARKQRSVKQALLLLQEHTHTAWRSRKVVTLVSFDVKRAYNGLCKERLLQRLAARGIPWCLVRRIDAFCSKRTVRLQAPDQRPNTCRAALMTYGGKFRRSPRLRATTPVLTGPLRALPWTILPENG